MSRAIGIGGGGGYSAAQTLDQRFGNKNQRRMEEAATNRYQDNQYYDSRRIREEKEVSAAEEGRRLYTGNDTNRNPDLESLAQNAPLVRTYKQELKEIEKEIDEVDQKIDGFNELKRLVNNLKVVSNMLRKPRDPTDNAFEYVNDILSTNETIDTEATNYMTVDVKPGAKSGQTKVSVVQLATAHTINVATTDNTEATDINNAVQALVGPSTPATVITTISSTISAGAGFDGIVDGSDYPSGRPRNPNSYILYEYAIQAKNTPGATLASVQAAVGNSYALMTSVSQGFSSLTTTAVTTLGTGATFTAGSYLLLSMPGSYQIANNIKNMLVQANSVYNGISAIVADPVTPANVTAAIAGISGLTYNGSGLPSNNTFAYSIANAAYTQAGTGGGANTNANVLAAASDEATTALTSLAAKNYMTNNYADDSSYLDNIFAKSLLGSIKTAAGATGATLSSITNSTTSAYSTYIANCTVSLTNGDYVQTVIDKINRTTEYSGVRVEAEGAGAGSVILKITAANTGTSYKINILNSSYADVSSSASGGVGPFYGSTITTIKNPQNSMATFSGLPRMSDSLKIYQDLSQKVAINLIKANTTPNTNYQTITIQNDQDAALFVIEEFKTAYNQLIEYIESFETTSQVKIGPTTQYTNSKNHPLADHSIITSLKRELKSIPRQPVLYNDGGPQSLFGVGFEATKDYRSSNQTEGQSPSSITFNPAKFLEVYNKSPDQVSRVFQFNYISSEPAFRLVTHTGVFNTISNLRITINPEVDVTGTGATPTQDTMIQVLKQNMPLSQFNLDAHSVYTAIEGLNPLSTYLQSDVVAAIAGIGSLTYSTGIPNNNNSAQTIALAAYNATNTGPGVLGSVIRAAALTALNSIEVASTQYLTSKERNHDNITSYMIICDATISGTGDHTIYSRNSTDGLTFVYTPGSLSGLVTSILTPKQGVASFAYGLCEAHTGSNEYRGDGKIDAALKLIEGRDLDALQRSKDNKEAQINEAVNEKATDAANYKRDGDQATTNRKILQQSMDHDNRRG